MSTISASTTSTTAYKVTADTTGTLVLQTGASPTTAVTIDSSQNVGIGTSPNARLDVSASNSGGQTSIQVVNTSNTSNSDTRLYIGVYPNSRYAFTQYGVNGVGSWNTGYDVASASFKISNDGAGTLNTNTRLTLDTNGNMGQNSSTPATYNSSGKVFTQTGTANNSGPSAHMMQGSSSNPGAGYYCREAFALASISNTATEITRITGTGANGMGMYIRVTVSGHTSSIANAMNYKGVFYVGGTSAVTQVETATSGTIPTITFDTSTSNVLVIKLASASVGQVFNGVMVVEWFVPVDFASSTWTIS